MNKVFIVVESSYFDNDYKIIVVYDSLGKATNYAHTIMSTYSKRGLWKEGIGTSWKNDEYEWELQIWEHEVI
jgi:hypothetical protein